MSRDRECHASLAYAGLGTWSTRKTRLLVTSHRAVETGHRDTFVQLKSWFAYRLSFEVHLQNVQIFINTGTCWNFKWRGLVWPVASSDNRQVRAPHPIQCWHHCWNWWCLLPRWISYCKTLCKDVQRLYTSVCLTTFWDSQYLAVQMLPSQMQGHRRPTPHP